MDENEFYRQAALQILSSLDLSKAVGRCFSIPSLVMPVDWMSLHLYSVLPSSCRCHLNLQHQKVDPDVKITTLLQQLPLRITNGSQSQQVLPGSYVSHRKRETLAVKKKDLVAARATPGRNPE